MQSSTCVSSSDVVRAIVEFWRVLGIEGRALACGHPPRGWKGGYMKKVLLPVTCGALLFFVAGADAAPNLSGKWALHIEGEHDAKLNTCGLIIQDCITQVQTTAPAGPGRFDVYVLAIDVYGIAGTRYGICSDDSFYFYGWTKCSVFEIPTPGWPGTGEGNAQTWSSEIPGPHVTVGILDVYVYPGVSRLELCVDPRVGFAEFCDGSQSSPLCNQHTSPAVFGSVGFGRLGYNTCDSPPVPVENRSWGAVKALYN